MKVNKVIETSLYVSDLERSIQFYEKVFEFEKLISDERFCAFSVGGQHVLLLFQKDTTNEPIPTPAGVIPPHHGSGELHLAFAIDTADTAAWQERLAANEIPIESTANWPRGGRSLYFRDPDQHLLELITPGCWSIY